MIALIGGAALGGVTAVIYMRWRSKPWDMGDHRLIAGALALGWVALRVLLGLDAVASFWLAMTVAAWVVCALAPKRGGGGGGGGDDGAPEAPDPGPGGLARPVTVSDVLAGQSATSVSSAPSAQVPA